MFEELAEDVERERRRARGLPDEPEASTSKQDAPAPAAKPAEPPAQAEKPTLTFGAASSKSKRRKAVGQEDGEQDVGPKRPKTAPDAKKAKSKAKTGPLSFG